MTAAEDDSAENAAQVGHQMFHRVGVQRDYGDAGGPFVVDFVDMFVEQFVMQ